MFEEGEGEERVGSYAIFLAEGESLAKQGEYIKAIESFTKVLWRHIYFLLAYLYAFFLYDRLSNSSLKTEFVSLLEANATYSKEMRVVRSKTPKPR